MSEKSKKVRSVRVQVAQGGWTCEVEYEPEPSKGKDNCSPCWEPTTPRVFTEKTAMLTAIGELLDDKPKSAKHSWTA